MLAEQPDDAQFSAASQTLFREVTALLLDPSTDTETSRAAAYPRLAAMLASSLQLLKAADEEIARRDTAANTREEALRGEIAHERKLFDDVGVPLIMSDLSGTILAANRAARRLLGAEHEELAGASLSTYLASSERADFRTTLGRLRAAGTTPDWQVRVQPRRHSALTMRASVVVIEDGNRKSGAPGLSWCLLPTTSEA
ncbi:MAG TPA: PAS domain-containing protein [Gemmatimonadaceae bacterium]|jgi:PAS domain S-box-containing protein